MAAKPIPDGYHSLTPYLVVKGAAAAIEFYKKAFGANERFRMPGPDGRVGHAELQFGDSVIMLADECPERGATAPQGGGLPVSLYFYTDNVDAVVERAVSAGDDQTADAEHRVLVQTIDKAVKRGALHRNSGARKKSRAARVRRGA